MSASGVPTVGSRYPQEHVLQRKRGPYSVCSVGPPAVGSIQLAQKELSTQTLSCLDQGPGARADVLCLASVSFTKGRAGPGSEALSWRRAEPLLDTVTHGRLPQNVLLRALSNCTELGPEPLRRCCWPQPHLHMLASAGLHTEMTAPCPLLVGAVCPCGCECSAAWLLGPPSHSHTAASDTLGGGCGDSH